jgi:hypothetical protein
MDTWKVHESKEPRPRDDDGEQRYERHVEREHAAEHRADRQVAQQAFRDEDVHPTGGP